ncbi:M15 family metallopeptidase [Pseudolabrys sp.]|uniref:M15 family metallopeptidase n=1 Tax=Pseudolabrys sp. TaxID=1960880 RepID=UPI003D140C26
MSAWPKDNQNDLIAFYGDPGRGEVERQLVKVVPPFQMYYDGRPLKYIRFHRKAAPALTAALNDIWQHYGRDQATINRLGVSNCAGTYNPRRIRGSKTRWSNHAFGAAIDLAAGQNGFNAADADHDGYPGTIPQPVVQAFKRQGARWGGDYRGRKDPMHFEFCDAGHQSVAFAGLPEADNDNDPNAANDNAPPPHDVSPDFEPKQPWYKKVWTWATAAVTGGTFTGIFYDWRAVLGVAVLAFIVFLFVWFGYLRQKLRKELERE